MTVKTQIAESVMKAAGISISARLYIGETGLGSVKMDKLEVFKREYLNTLQGMFPDGAVTAKQRFNLRGMKSTYIEKVKNDPEMSEIQKLAAIKLMGQIGFTKPTDDRHGKYFFYDSTNPRKIGKKSKREKKQIKKLNRIQNDAV